MVIPTNHSIGFPAVLSQVLDVFPKDIEIFLVGGAVRDALLTRPIHDYDFVLCKDALKIGRKVAN